ncbi:transmembrane protein 45B-like [Tubulanus polymorphus]|uniref:transmembrane protein 45B-like n=1 Tax=Tubulanus polymorphus TaxID=672921 RepID=UPI003DA3A19B
MGSFQGHVLPGSFFLVFALHWTIQIWIRYFKSKYESSTYRNSATYPLACLCGCFKRYQIEGVIKILVASIGIFGEVTNSYMQGGRFVVYIGNKQHSTMYAPFIVSGIVDILLHHKVRFVPKNSDYIALALAFTVEGLLFKFHLFGRNAIDIQIHTLLLYAIFCSALAILVQMRFPNNVLAGLTSAFFVLLQGTWFWQVAFILYNPRRSGERWSSEDHEHLMITTIMFGWHALIILIVIFTIGAIVNVFYCRILGYRRETNIEEIDLENMNDRREFKRALLAPQPGESDSETDILLSSN